MARLSLLLLLTTAAFAEDRVIAEFRLLKDPGSSCYGWLVEYDEQGFRFERFGSAQRSRLAWTDLVAEDSLALRRRLGLALDEAEGAALVKGHRLRFQSGATIEGLLLRVDEQKRHWVKCEGVVMPYPGDMVDRVEEIELPETRIYAPDELYAMRLQRRPPKNAQEHAELAGYLVEIGNFAGAREQYEAALAADPILRAEIEPRLQRIGELLSDADAARVFAQARRRAFLDGDAEGAERAVRKLLERRPELARRGLSFLDEMQETCQERLARSFHAVKNRQVELALDDYLARNDPGLKAAMEWCRTQLPQEVERRVRDRLGIGPGQYADLRGRPATGAAHWASYSHGTFVIGKRTEGIGSRQPDPEDWWARYDDRSLRKSFLKAWSAEHLPDLFEIVQVYPHDCPRCGGRGKVKHMSFQSVGRAGQHEWWETCPQCWGNCQERAVAYR